MENLLLSVAIGDIAGSAYERIKNSTKCYDDVLLFHPQVRFTDDTVCTFACADALLNNLDMSATIYRHCVDHFFAGYGRNFCQWLRSRDPKPYNSLGNGSAMRCSAAAWLARSEEECVRFAIALGGDADTLAAIAAPMAYAFYREMPRVLVDKALALLPKWMTDLNDVFDRTVAAQ